MIKGYTIQLDGKPGSPNKKYDCPFCGHKKRFRRYYNYETREYLSDDCGRCDRPRCDGGLTPKQYFDNNPNAKPKAGEFKPVVIEPKKLVNMPVEVLRNTLNNYESNSFIKPLLQYFPKHQIEQVIADYMIGTVKGAFSVETPQSSPAVFWFINECKEVRAGQIKLFNDECNTVKTVLADGELKACTTWMHSYLKKQYQKARVDVPKWIYDYSESEKVTCFYGQHLLSKYKNKPIALVEAPKTCIIGTLLYPSYLWLATGSLSYFTKERAKVLAGRKVVIFPDSGIPNQKTGKTCADLWQERLADFMHLAHFRLSDLLEKVATPEEKERGFDLADYWLRELRNRPVNILIEDIVQGRGGHYTGPVYDNIFIQTIVTKQGRVFDLFFDENGEPITPNNGSKAIEKLAVDFRKNLTIGAFNGSPCLLHII